MSGTDGRAEIGLGVSGQDKVIRAAEDIRSAYVRTASHIGTAFHGVGGRIRSALGSAIENVGDSLQDLTKEATRAVSEFGRFNLDSAIRSAEQFNQGIARTAVAWGQHAGKLKENLTGVSKTILVGEPQILAEANALADLTGSYEDAVGEMQGLGKEAIATGRSLGEMRQLGEVLHNVMGVAGDTEEALGKMRAQAEDMGTIGGAVAFARQIESLSGVLDHFSVKSTESRDRLTGLIAVLGKGLAPNVAGRVQAQVLGSLDSSALDISRTLGRDILDEQGRVKDPAQVLIDLQRSMQRRGLSTRRQKLAWRRYLGNQAGSRVFQAFQDGSLSPEGIAHVAGLAPSEHANEATEEFRNDAEGQRVSMELASQRKGREAAAPILHAQEAWGHFFAENPITGLIAGNMLGAIGLTLARKLGLQAGRLAGWVGGGAGEALAAGGHAAGGLGAATAGAGGHGALLAGEALVGTAEAAEAAEGALLTASNAFNPFLLALAGAAAQLGALATVGEDRDKMGEAWRQEHGDIIEGEEAWTPTAIRARREKRERQDVDELIQFGLTRSDRNKDYGAKGFEDMVRAYNPGLYERSKDSDLLKAVVKALETGKVTPELGKEIGDKVAQAIKENPPVSVQPDADHPVKVVRGSKGQARPKWESLFNGRGRHGG